jgi:ribonuclease HII
MPKTVPSTRLERSLFAQGAERVAGVDEVGRGAWAGPLSVGIAVATPASLRRLPRGVNDSKMLTPASRDALFDPLRSTVTCYAVGHASPQECDELGMTKAQNLAFMRALAQLDEAPDALVVDGKFDFTRDPRTTMLVGADRLTRIVAAASVLAKVTRDRMMIETAPEFPAYRFEQNKGYPSPEHRQALAAHGVSDFHRRSWSFALNLPD